MTDRNHQNATDFIAERHRERARGALGEPYDPIVRIPEDAKRHAAIIAAIGRLKPAAGADVGFAIMDIELWLYLCCHNAAPARHPLPSDGAEQLRGFAEALRAARTAARDLNSLASEHLNAAKVRLAVEWCSPSAHSFLHQDEFGDFLDWGYPSLAKAAEDAAEKLDQMKKSGPPKVERNNLLEFATNLAAIFELLTGTRPRPSGSGGRFAVFVETIFAAAEGMVDARSTLQLARKGAALHCLDRERNPG